MYFIDPFDKLSSTQPTDQFPKTQFQYNIKTTGESLTPGASANVVRRYSEGMILIEEPINEFYSTSSGVSPSVQVVYVGSGQFTTYWTTTLAGQYDIAVLVRPCNDQGEFSSPTFDAICAAVPCVEAAKGKAGGSLRTSTRPTLNLHLLRILRVSV